MYITKIKSSFKCNMHHHMYDEKWGKEELL
jgi:hypothetical protein